MKKHALQVAHQFCLDFFNTHQQKVEHWQPLLMGGIILLILTWGIYIAKQPITVVQQQELQRLSQHYLYPHSQNIAQDLLQQSEPIYRYQYFHFLRVVEDEAKRLTVQEELKWEKKQTSASP